eukprot:m.105703 g.105703  ORF g.105703 m.105703 type:complete len:417 (+) comp14206_c2_seq3:1891-3141(+)
MALFLSLAHIIGRARSTISQSEIVEEKSVRNLIIPQLDSITAAYDRADKSTPSAWTDMTIEVFLEDSRTGRETHIERWYASFERKPAIQSMLLCRAVYLHLRLLPLQRYKMRSHNPRVGFVIIKGPPPAAMTGITSVIPILDIDQREGAFRMRVEYLASLDAPLSPAASPLASRARSSSANTAAGAWQRPVDPAGPEIEDRPRRADSVGSRPGTRPINIPGRRAGTYSPLHAGSLPAGPGSPAMVAMSPKLPRVREDALPERAGSRMRADDLRAMSLPTHVAARPSPAASSAHSSELPFASPISPPTARHELPIMEQLPRVFASSPDHVSVCSDVDHYSSNASLADRPHVAEDLPFALEVEGESDLSSFMRRLEEAPDLTFERQTTLAQSMRAIEFEMNSARAEMAMLSQSLRSQD